jgi:hypothetical protein
MRAKLHPNDNNSAQISQALELLNKNDHMTVHNNRHVVVFVIDHNENDCPHEHCLALGLFSSINSTEPR